MNDAGRGHGEGRDVVPEARPSSAFAIALAWLVASAPLAWGVYQTLKKALQLFQ